MEVILLKSRPLLGAASEAGLAHLCPQVLPLLILLPGGGYTPHWEVGRSQPRVGEAEAVLRRGTEPGLLGAVSLAGLSEQQTGLRLVYLAWACSGCPS